MFAKIKKSKSLENSGANNATCAADLMKLKQVDEAQYDDADDTESMQIKTLNRKNRFSLFKRNRYKNDTNTIEEPSFFLADSKRANLNGNTSRSFNNIFRNLRKTLKIPKRKSSSCIAIARKDRKQIESLSSFISPDSVS